MYSAAQPSKANAKRLALITPSTSIQYCLHEHNAQNDTWTRTKASRGGLYTWGLAGGVTDSSLWWRLCNITIIQKAYRTASACPLWTDGTIVLGPSTRNIRWIKTLYFVCYQSLCLTTMWYRSAQWSLLGREWQTWCLSQATDVVSGMGTIVTGCALWNVDTCEPVNSKTGGRSVEP